jgi:lipid-A-disaccharide synthase
MKPRSRKIFIVAGEHSGDELGAKLMAAMVDHSKDALLFSGVGGPAMADQGLVSLFPLSDVAVMGPMAILRRLPLLVRRVYQTVDAALKAEPDLVIIVDSPEFTHPIAKRIRAKRPDIPIIDYVSPSVWAWRPGRARKMRPYVDHVLALLPFEPEAHERLGGPACTYVGHPLIERSAWIRSLPSDDLARRLQLQPDRPVIVVLPGSRSTEVSRLMEPFGQTLALLMQTGVTPEVIVPAVPSVRGLIEEHLARWPLRPHLVEGERDKFMAFRLGDAALAASGTVTLELGLTGVPMVVAYRVDGLAARLRFLLKVPSVVLANLVLGENAFPEYLQEDCTPEKLAAGLKPLLGPTPERAAQVSALAQVQRKMLLDGESPSDRAASVVLRILQGGRREALRTAAR